MRKSRILITGARGMLGQRLVELCPATHEPLGLGRDDLDVTSLPSFRDVAARVKPAAIIHAAAMTNVDGCETAFEDAMRINGIGARNAAIAAEESGAVCLLLSTDYVFDGESEDEYVETDPVGPRSVYGRSKHMGEVLASMVTNRLSIVRTQWLYGPGGKNFVDTIAEAARTREELRIVDDQRGCPTFTRDLARGIYHLLAHDAGPGIYHCSGRGSCTWFELGKKIVELTGRSTRVVPMPSTELDRPAPRPRNSVLRNLALELTVGDPMPEWEESLRDYLEGRG